MSISHVCLFASLFVSVNNRGLPQPRVRQWLDLRQWQRMLAVKRFRVQAPRQSCSSTGFCFCSAASLPQLQDFADNILHEGMQSPSSALRSQAVPLGCKVAGHSGMAKWTDSHAPHTSTFIRFFLGNVLQEHLSARRLNWTSFRSSCRRLFRRYVTPPCRLPLNKQRGLLKSSPWQQ